MFSLSMSTFAAVSVQDSQISSRHSRQRTYMYAISSARLIQGGTDWRVLLYDVPIVERSIEIPQALVVISRCTYRAVILQDQSVSFDSARTASQPTNDLDRLP